MLTFGNDGIYKAHSKPEQNEVVQVLNLLKMTK